jgi:hypothetical protein
MTLAPSRNRRNALALVAIVGVASLGVGAAAGASRGTVSPADSLATGYERTLRIDGDRLERADPDRLPATARAAGGRRASLALKYYIGTEFQAVASGSAQLFEVRCPLPGQEAMTGGVFAPVAGLVISNSSRTSPEPTFPTHSRAWYQAVTNLSGAELHWKPFVTCVQP